jgi:hypothetical protein
MFDAHNWERRWFAYFGMLLSRSRRSNATDPRDKVYSLLGIWPMTSPQGRLCIYLDAWLSRVGKSLDATSYVRASTLEIKPSYRRRIQSPRYTHLQRHLFLRVPNIWPFFLLWKIGHAAGLPIYHPGFQTILLILELYR